MRKGVLLLEYVAGLLCCHSICTIKAKVKVFVLLEVEKKPSTPVC